MTKPSDKFVYHDGGRAEAGYKGKAGDCVTRAIAIATGQTYKEVFDKINELAKSERTGKRKKGISNANSGVYKQTIKKYLASIGAVWTPTMLIGQGCKVHLKASELPKGRLVVSVSKHSVAVIDGVIYDNHDCSRNGKRCVYGYHTIPESFNTPKTNGESFTEDYVRVKQSRKLEGEKITRPKKDVEKLAKLLERKKNWESKKKRADNTLKGLDKKIKYYIKKLEGGK